MSLGTKIRNIRKSKGYSIMKIKELTGLSKSTISEIENDKSSPTALTLEKLANALDVSVMDFFEEEKEDKELEKAEQKIQEYSDENKIFFSKYEKLSDNAKKQMLKIIETFEDETQD